MRPSILSGCDGSWRGLLSASESDGCSLAWCFQFGSTLSGSTFTEFIIYFPPPPQTFNNHGGCGRASASILCSSGSDLYFLSAFIRWHRRSSTAPVWSASQLECFSSICQSHLGAHVLHPGQGQLSQVAVLHSGAHQRHGDVPEGWSHSRGRGRQQIDT